MNFNRSTVLSCVVILLLSVAVRAAENVSVNVLRDVKPLFYLDDKNVPGGIYVDLIRAIGEREGWNVSFSCNSWGDGIEKVRKNEITLMPGVLKSKEREVFLDFHTIPVMVSWGQVAVRDNSTISSIPDLEGKTVGIMERDLNAVNFKKLLDEFHITCSFIEVPTHSDIVPLIESGRADAGVFYSMFPLTGSGIKTTSIVFNPAEGFFATAKGRNGRILKSIDQYLKNWKSDKSSPYYAILQKNTSGADEKKVIPRWVYYGSGGVVVLFLLGFGWIISLNILVRKKTVELKYSEQRFFQSLNKSPVALAISDDAGNIHLVNDRFTRIFGYTGDDLPKVDVWFRKAYPDETVRSNLYDEWNRRVETFHKTGMFLTMETKVCCKDGTTEDILFDFEAVDNLQVTTFTVVTEQRRTEMALRESEANYRTVANYTYDWEYWQLPDKKMKYVSPSCKRITGYEVKEFIDDPALVESIVLPEDRDAFVKHYQGRPQRCDLFEYRILTKEGLVRWIAHSCQIITSADNKVEGIRVNNRDVTAMKQMQEQLRQSQKMQAIGQLAGGIAHDFNNILGGIIGYSELSLDMVERGGVVDGYLNQILNAGERARKLVKQILTFSRQGPEEKSVIFLKPVIKEVLELLKVSIPSSVQLKVTIADCRYPVLADATKIHESLMNLAANAVYAMTEKGVLSVSLREERLASPLQGRLGTISAGVWNIIEIKDTGSGMSEETLDRIFDPFFTTKPAGKGTGLGLSVVYGVCRMHDADIQVESIPGQGTTFRLFFPVADEPVNTSSSDTTVCPTGTERILLVDDEPVLTDMGAKMLVSLGYKVTASNSASEALALINNNPQAFDCLVTDQTMPGIQGIDLIRQVRAMNLAMPLVLCTGFSNTVNETIAREAGVSSFLLKPLKKIDLAITLRNVLDEHPAQGAQMS